MRRIFLVLWVAAAVAGPPAVAVTNNTPIPGAPVIVKRLPPHPVYGSKFDFTTTKSPWPPANVFEQSYVIDPYRRPYMGLQIRDMGAQLASFFGVEGGVLVESVDTNGPAHEAEVQAGDIIVSFQDRPVGSMDALFAELDDMRSGDEIKLEAIRRRDPLTFTLRLADRPKPPDEFAVPEEVQNMLGKVNVIFGDDQTKHINSLIESMRQHIPSMRMQAGEARRTADEQVRRELEQLRTEFNQLRQEMRAGQMQTSGAAVENGPVTPEK